MVTIEILSLVDRKVTKKRYNKSSSKSNFEEQYAVSGNNSNHSNSILYTTPILVNPREHEPYVLSEIEECSGSLNIQ